MLLLHTSQQAAQPSLPSALPVTQLAAGPLWLSEGKQAKKDVFLPTQVAALPFGTNGILQHSLAPLSHSRLRFIVQHTLAEIWSVKVHRIC